jgi:ABC-type transport system involved in multi-copper enzyme maturation permease subunit
MMLLPIVHRELRVAARRRGTYRLRFWLALAMVGMWLCLLRFGQSSLPASQQGQSLFRASGILALAFSLLAGAFLTADCLSEEKREGTLGLLFLSDLKGYDVVLGKLVANSLHGFYGLLAVLPLLAMPLLIGSVTAGEFWRIGLALAATLLLSLSIGMLVSALWVQSRQTMTLTLEIMFLVATIPDSLGFLWRQASSWAKGGGWQILSAPSPLYLFWAGLDVNYSAPASWFWTSFCTILVLACGALVFPSFYAPRAWRETGGAARAESSGGWRSPRLGSTRSRLRRRGRLEVNPFYWLASRDLTPRWTAWGLLVPLFCIWAGFMLGSLVFSWNGHAISGIVSVLTAYFMHQVLKYLVAAEASRRLSEDRRSGTIEPLLVAPVSEEEIVAGQKRALVSLFAGPAILVLVTNLVLAFGLFLAAPSMPVEFWLLLLSAIGGAAILFFDLHALSLVGMWLAVKVPGHRRAVFGTLARVMLGPWLAVACLVLIRGLGGGVAFESIICWLGISALIDLTLANRAREELTRGLRDHAPQSTAPETLPEPGLETTEAMAVAASNRSQE